MDLKITENGFKLMSNGGKEGEKKKLNNFSMKYLCFE